MVEMTTASSPSALRCFMSTCALAVESDYAGGEAVPELLSSVYLLNPTDDEVDLVANHIACPNGLYFSFDECRQYVAETGRYRVVNQHWTPCCTAARYQLRSYLCIGGPERRSLLYTPVPSLYGLTVNVPGYQWP